MGARPANRDDRRENFDRLRASLRDPLLTTLTLLLVFWMFVLAPLHAASVIDTDAVGFVLALAVTGALLILSRNPAAVLLMLAAIALAAAAAWLRLQQPSGFDVFLNACAWTLIGFTLAWVVGWAVFAPGRVTYHRVMGAILLYLAIGLTFVALFTFVGLAVPDAFSGMSVKDSPALSSTMIYFSFSTLTGSGGDITPVHPVARSLFNMETILGQLYPATLLARLVTLEIEGETKRG
jgi:hypothetical protein